MEYEEFIQFFTHEVSYNLKMLGVPWRAKYENTGGRRRSFGGNPWWRA